MHGETVNFGRTTFRWDYVIKVNLQEIRYDVN